MGWFNLHRKAVAIALVVVGGVLFLAGVAFFFIDAKLMEEMHMSAATLMNLMRSIVQGGIGMGQSIIDSPLADYGLALANGLGPEGIIEMLIPSLPPEDQLTVRVALFVLPLVPYKWTFTLVGLLVLAMGLLLLGPARAISLPGIGKGPVIPDFPRGPVAGGPGSRRGMGTGGSGHSPYGGDSPSSPGPGGTWSPPGTGGSGYPPYHGDSFSPPGPGGSWPTSDTGISGYPPYHGDSFSPPGPGAFPPSPGSGGNPYPPDSGSTFYTPVPGGPLYPIGVVPIPYSPEPTGSCPRCGAALREDARFCGQCGYSLTPERSPDNPGLQAAGPL